MTKAVTMMIEMRRDLVLAFWKMLLRGSSPSIEGKR